MRPAATATRAGNARAFTASAYAAPGLRGEARAQRIVVRGRSPGRAGGLVGPRARPGDAIKCRPRAPGQPAAPLHRHRAWIPEGNRHGHLPTPLAPETKTPARGWNPAREILEVRRSPVWPGTDRYFAATAGVGVAGVAAVAAAGATVVVDAQAQCRT